MVDSQQRRAHWIKLNHQNRIPNRWIAFDTESKSWIKKGVETQTWNLACAYRWRTSLKAGDAMERAAFYHPEPFWEWVTEFCRPEQRTVIWAHNLGYDSRISAAFDLLPKMGWRLEWSNLSSSVSSMTWRSNRGTLVFADLFTWLPMPLEEVGKLVGLDKLDMPTVTWAKRKWLDYCYRDAEIVYRAVSDIVKFIDTQDLGNWQPTGAGMAFATWRHKFMTEKVLVHDNESALTAERQAMHTGRAEAWRHGELRGDRWYEVDIRQAYTRLAATSNLPTKIKFHTGAISRNQYMELRSRFAVLCKIQVRTDVPCLPTHRGQRHIWPIGEFTSWLWDAEVDLAMDECRSVRILESYVYTRHPILEQWALWVLKTQGMGPEVVSPVVAKWIKHSGRTLIGRLALRSSQWQVWGANPERAQGISHMVDVESGNVTRMMHVGDQTFQETGKVEGKDSLPQITGYIMSKCRVQLWQAMKAAGFLNIAHVDTDGLIVNDAGLIRLQNVYGAAFDSTFQIKARYNSMIVYSPRNYRGDDVRKTSGVPRKAVEVAPNVFEGESWSSLARDLGEGETDRVTVMKRTWELSTEDPRRMSAPGAGTYTVPYVMGQSVKVESSDVPTVTSGS